MYRRVIPNNRKSNSFISSKIINIIFIFVAILLFYFINFFHQNNKKNTVKKTLSLPISEQKNTKILDFNQENKWQTIDARSGDSLSSIFKRVGLSNKILQTVINDISHSKLLSTIKPGQQLQLIVNNNVLQKLKMPLSITHYLIIERKDNHYTSKIIARKTHSHNEYVTATVHGSLSATAKRLKIPFKVIQQMTNIFNWEIDFAKEVRENDRFTIIYKAFYIENKQVNAGDIIAISYTNHGKTHQAIRFTNAAGEDNYYTPEGYSLNKAFSRYPVKFSHISSTFSLSRKHPTLHYNRPHKGIDLAAPIGTPVRATGDGRIQIIGRHNGYGNMVKISHNKIYASIYAHLLKFQEGLTIGSYVKRDQIIGFVGQTGLATGPHCHYEFHIDHTAKNPTTIELPRAAPIPPNEIAAFRIDSVALLNHLKLFEDANLARNGKKLSRNA